MSKIIQHKKSRIAGNKPNVTQIDVGEIAINFTDRSVYTRDVDDVIVELARDVWRTSSQPDSAMEGDFWYNTTSNSVSYWDGTAWEDIAVSEELMDSAGVIEIVTSSDLDMEGNKVLFGNVYPTDSDLPDASTYHGMFAHVHSTGAGYFAHAGNWVQLANQSFVANLDSDLSDLQTLVGDPTTIDATSIKSLTFVETVRDVSYDNVSGNATLEINLANNFAMNFSTRSSWTVLLSAAPSDPGDAFACTLVIDTSGLSFLGWDPRIKWVEGEAPDFDNGLYMLTFYTKDGGISYYGILSGGPFV